MFSARVLRRRWILAVIFLGSLLYFIYTSLQRKTLVSDVYEVKHTILRQPFQWQPKLHDVESNGTKKVFCRNSVQGSHVISDDRGYVCKHEDINRRGCCDIKSSKSTRYNCSTCKSNGCCIVYEHCVSCCLQPEKQPVLKRILKDAAGGVDQLLDSVADQFELCLAKCRTSSKSVQHENSYRDPKAKHCYGEDLPDLQTVVR